MEHNIEESLSRCDCNQFRYDTVVNINYFTLDTNKLNLISLLYFKTVSQLLKTVENTVWSTKIGLQDLKVELQKVCVNIFAFLYRHILYIIKLHEITEIENSIFCLLALTTISLQMYEDPPSVCSTRSLTNLVEKLQRYEGELGNCFQEMEKLKNAFCSKDKLVSNNFAYVF